MRAFSIASPLRVQPQCSRARLAAGDPQRSMAVLPLLLAGEATAATAAAQMAGTGDLLALAQDYPLFSAGIAGVAAISTAAAVAFSPGRPRVQSTDAEQAYESLEEERTILVDLRPKRALKEEGVLDLKGVGNKKPLSLVYAEVDEEGDLLVDEEFAAKLKQTTGVTQGSIIIVIDSDGSLAPKAAAAAARGDFFAEKVSWVRGGVEGLKGWKASGLPTKPYRAFELPSLPSLLPLPATLELPTVDLTALSQRLQAPEVVVTDAVERVGGAVNNMSDKFKENPTLANGVLAVAGVAAAGAFAFTEMEAVLQVVGALGLARYMAANLLFAKDREATLAAARAFLEEKGIDPTAMAQGVGADLQRLAAIVREARDAAAAAQRITAEMVPGADVKGANPEALAAALAAAGVEMPIPMSMPIPASFPADPVAAAAASEPGPAQVVVSGAEVAAPVTAAVAAVAAVEVTVPANVVEARAWISSWKSSNVAPADAALAEPAAAAAAAADAAEPIAAMGAAVAEEELVQTPATVLEAREWIAAWRLAGSAAAPAATAEVPAAAAPTLANVAEVREWIAAWRSSSAAAATATDVAEVTLTPEPTPMVAAAAAAVQQQQPQRTAVPANVAEAREWIAAWRSAAAAAANVTAAAIPVEGREEAPTPANVADARKWIAAWKVEQQSGMSLEEELTALAAAAGGGAAAAPQDGSQKWEVVISMST